MTSHSDMRQADINRVNKAREHLKAAVTILLNIKWENRTMTEDYFIAQAGEGIADAQRNLEDIIHFQK